MLAVLRLWDGLYDSHGPWVRGFNQASGYHDTIAKWLRRQIRTERRTICFPLGA